MTKKLEVEITSPAGSWESLRSAIKAGADSVYFGAGKLNMRSRAAANFAKKDIAKIAEICRHGNVKAYMALNSLIYDDDIAEMKTLCDAGKSAGVSAIIVTDFAALEYARSIGLPVHISVQMNVCNFESLKYFAKFADTVVLARELSLSQIAKLAQKIRDEKLISPSGDLLKIEVFVHGALCVAVAGKCYMSIAAYNKSANRGECYQNCRRGYRVIDEDTGNEFLIDNKFVMSPKDLCCIRILDKIIHAGASVLKIEGRGRSPEYVYETTKAYKKAAELVVSGIFTLKKGKDLEKKLETVFNRGFWHGGYYLGDKAGEWSGISGSRAAKTRIFSGKITNYFPKAGCAEILVQCEAVSVNDEILVIGTTTGIVQFTVSEIRANSLSTKIAEKGSTFTVPAPEKVRRGDKIYILRNSQN
jgi:putative protease